MSAFELITAMGHEQVVYCHDSKTDLKAIIAIHNTKLGPALGGCRMWPYQSEAEALKDVLRLSRGMTYKAAVANLKLGGGKAVIIGDPKKIKSEALFRSFGKFVDSLGGKYITAEDVNIKVEDIENVAKETKHVTGITSRPGGSGDPSPFTALGVYHGIRATVKYKLKTDSLKGLRIGVKGLGAVGGHLCKHLYEDGAKIFVADIAAEKVQDMVTQFGATAVPVDQIHMHELDVLSPCALGADLHDQSIPQIKARVIAGGANNQLADEKIHGKQLKDRGILYAPDYVINAGGLINVYQEIIGYNKDAANKKTAEIYDTLLKIFAEAEQRDIPTYQASNLIAERAVGM